MRRPDQKPDEDLHDWRVAFACGDWGKDKDGLWWVCLPDEKFGFGALSIAKHTVIEHADGTITVKPSILARFMEQHWHGYLENGKWTKI